MEIGTTHTGRYVRYIRTNLGGYALAAKGDMCSNLERLGNEMCNYLGKNISKYLTYDMQTKYVFG